MIRLWNTFLEPKKKKIANKKLCIFFFFCVKKMSKNCESNTKYFLRLIKTKKKVYKTCAIKQCPDNCENGSFFWLMEKCCLIFCEFRLNSWPSLANCYPKIAGCPFVQTTLCIGFNVCVLAANENPTTKKNIRVTQFNFRYEKRRLILLSCSYWCVLYLRIAAKIESHLHIPTEIFPSLTIPHLTYSM